MSDQAAEQQNDDTAAETAAEETATVTEDSPADGGGGESGDDTPQEGKPADTFDPKRAEAKIRKANSEAANLRKRLKELEPLAAKARELEDAQKSETERLQGQLAEAETRVERMRSRAVRSEVRALAAAAFADATDPEAHLDLSAYVSDDGEIDTDQIKTDLEELLERKPHLGKPKPEQERRRPAPDRTQASGANQPRTKDPADEFAGFFRSQLQKSR